ncbi:hypothetical protein I4U23_019285 [Adineta vaga]|nr:hypothetical protein I4U23_019285 [Adineta vaga]
MSFCLVIDCVQEMMKIIFCFVLIAIILPNILSQSFSPRECCFQWSVLRGCCVNRFGVCCADRGRNSNSSPFRPHHRHHNHERDRGFPSGRFDRDRDNEFGSGGDRWGSRLNPNNRFPSDSRQKGREDTRKDDFQGTGTDNHQDTRKGDRQGTKKDDFRGTGTIDRQDTRKDDFQGTGKNDRQGVRKDDFQGTGTDNRQRTGSGDNQNTGTSRSGDRQRTGSDDNQNTGASRSGDRQRIGSGDNQNTGTGRRGDRRGDKQSE